MIDGNLLFETESCHLRQAGRSDKEGGETMEEQFHFM